MEKNPIKTSSGSGLELDRLEIPANSSRDTVSKSKADSELKSSISSEPGSSGKRQLRLTLTAVITTLVLLAVLAIYLKKQDLRVSSITFGNAPVSKSYLRVGPITTTITKDEVIRLSLEIGCKNDRAKKRLAEKDSRIRDKIVSVIDAPDTKTLLENHQYDAFRAKIKESLEKIYDEPIGEVYFAELLTY